MIDLERLHPGFKGNTFRYAPFLSITEDLKGSDATHCIKTHRKGERGGWMWLGDKNSPNGRLSFDTESEAREAAKQLNRWAAS